MLKSNCATLTLLQAVLQADNKQCFKQTTSSASALLIMIMTLTLIEPFKKTGGQWPQEA